jgi:hypothetical protein
VTPQKINPEDLQDDGNDDDEDEIENLKKM